MTADDLKATLAEAKTNLAQLRDELRVKMHLARKDAADTWESLEPRLKTAEAKLADISDKIMSGSEEARLQAKLGLAELKASWPGLRKAVDQVADDVKKGATDAKAVIDTARVKAHLAEMDAAVGAQDKIKWAEDELKKAGDQFKTDVEQTANEVKESLLSWKKRVLG